MNNLLVRFVLIALLLMLVTAPLGGLAPLMIFLLGLAVCWGFWSLVQAFFAELESEEQ